MNKPKYWKHELFRELYRLRDLFERDGPELVVARSVVLEKFVFVTALIMRKLAEADELTQEVVTSRWRVVELPQTRPPPPRALFKVSEDAKTWRQPLEKHYDFSSPRESELTFQQVCNRLIHHFAFEFRYQSDDYSIDILFNSDRSLERLFTLSLHDYTALVDEVAADEIRWVDTDRHTSKVIKRRYRPSLTLPPISARSHPISWRYSATRPSRDPEHATSDS